MNSLSNKKIKLGFLLLFISCIISAFSHVYTGATEQHLNPIAMCFYVIFFSIITFAALSFRQLKNIYHKSLCCYKEIIGINLATTGCWLFLFYPLKFLEPSIVDTLTICITPLATMIIGKFIYHHQNLHRYDYISAIVTFLMACYLISLGFLDKTAVRHIPVISNIFSILCCLIVSTSLAFSNTYAKKLSNRGFSPVETLTVRFILLAVLSGIITLFLKDGRSLATPSITIIAISIAVLSLIVIPQLIFQSAIRELQPISVAMVLPLMPVLTFFIEFYDKRLNPGLYTIAGILSILGITIFSAWLRYRQETRLYTN